MSGYINIKRGFFNSDIYKKSQCQQREVFLKLILRVNFENKKIDFGGRERILKKGQIWFSRRSLVNELRFANVKDSHIRYAVSKMIKQGFIKLVSASKSGGSIYECTNLFYKEIAEPFDRRYQQPTNEQPTNNQHNQLITSELSQQTTNEKTTNEQPTNNQPTTNEQPTNEQHNQLITSELNQQPTNEQPTNSQQSDNEQPTNNLNEINKQLTKELNNGNGIIENQNHFEKNVDLSLKKTKVSEIKVAVKNGFPAFDNVLPDVDFENPIDSYFSNQKNIEFWEKQYPLVLVSDELEKIRNVLNEKAANGNYQLNNPYAYVLKCLDNAEKIRQQRVHTQNKISKENKDGHKNKWAEKNGKILDPTKYKRAASGNQSPFI